MSKTKNDRVYLLCPVCGHDRHQIHDRGRVYYPETEGRPALEWDEMALQCLKCLAVFTDKEALLREAE